MFKKSSKQNIRRRRETDEDNPDHDDTENLKSTKTSLPVKSSNSEPKKEKSKKTKKISLLSFDNEEDEGSSFKLKKSSRSRRIAKEIKKRSQEEKDALANNNVNESSYNDAKNLKQSEDKNVHIFQSQKKPAVKANDALSKQALDSHLNSGAIPTPSMIHAARKQREMLRKFGSEHISMEDTQKYKETTQSRLVREDDGDSSDEGIMEMKGIEKKTKPVSKQFVPNESDDEVDPEEEEANEDEEVHRWEEEMIKKGINLQANPASLTQNLNPQQTNAYNSYTYPNTFYANQTESNQVAYRNVEAKSDVDFASLKKRIQDHLSSLKESNRSHQDEMENLVHNASECEHISSQLSDTAIVSKEYQFYQEMREYVRDLVGCLRENVPVIDTLEQNAHTLWKKQAGRLIARRRQDIKDESSQCSPMGVAVGQDRNGNGDEDYVQRVREREARRTRRRAARQIKKTASAHYEGMSTDDEETSMHQAQHNAELQRIQTARDEVFDDVVDEFCVVTSVLERFVEWREKQSNSYNDAYIALCIPKLIFPFIKRKALLWNPFLSPTTHFEENDWFKELAKFGLKNFSGDAEEDLSNVLDDTKVLSSVVEKVLVAKLYFFIENVWDPLSMKQTIRLSLLLKELIRDYPCMTVESHQCQKMVQSLCKRLQDSLDNDIFIPLLPPSSVETPAHIFLERQTWSCIKLFKNAMMLDGILSYKILCEMAFDSLLNRYIMLALQTSMLNVSCLYKCQRIVDATPKSWFNKYDGVLSHLSSLCRFLVHFAQSIKASEQVAGKTMIKQIKTMLLVIGARNSLSEL